MPIDLNSIYKAVKALGLLRNVAWLMISIILYCSAIVLADMDIFPKLQVICWKIGHVNIGAFCGYWLDRSIFRDRIYPDTAPLLQLRRAVMVIGISACIALGM